MKKFVLWWLFWSWPALAAPLSVDLQGVALPDFLRVAYGELLHRSYVLDASVVADKEAFSLNLRQVSPQSLEAEVKRVLTMRGYELFDASGVLTVKRKPQEHPGLEGVVDDGEVFIYRPQNRAVSYLLPLVEPLFKAGSFVGRRAVSQPLSAVSGQQVGVVNNAAPVMSPAVASNVAVSGLNAALNQDQEVLIFRGAEKDINRFKRLMVDLDVVPAEMIVKAVVFEVQTTKSEGSAVDLAVSILRGKLGLVLPGGAEKSGNGGLFAKTSGHGLDLSAFYSALSSDSRFKTLTAPRLRVKSGATARFSVGNETPVIGSTSYTSGGTAVQSVEYKSSGVIFELKPQIREDSAELKVNQQISEFVVTENGVNNSPTLLKRELSSEVVVRDGDVIFLGGLDQDKNTNSNSGLSFLPAFLRSSTDKDSKTEIVLMLNVQRL